MNKQTIKLNKQSGSAMLIAVIFFLFISLAIISGIVSPVLRYFKIGNDAIESKASFFLSESGVEDAYYRIKNSKPAPAHIALSLDGNTAETEITDGAGGEKIISALGDVRLKQRRNELVLNSGTQIAFSYVIHAGAGGFEIGNSLVNGNVYSNGNIISTNPNAFIDGSAVAAGGLIGGSGLLIGNSAEENAWAETVENSTISGNLYCQSGTGNNKACNPSLTNPSAVPIAITDDIIDLWKSHTIGDIHNGDLTITKPTALGGKRITGNLIIKAPLTITDTVYVMGNVSMVNGVTISLSTAYGPNLGVLVADGEIDLRNNVSFAGSGEEGSYLMLLSTSASTNAFDVRNNLEGVILAAPYGTINVKEGVSLNQMVANHIIIQNNDVINYLPGIAYGNFQSGPVGDLSIKSWRETE